MSGIVLSTVKKRYGHVDVVTDLSLTVAPGRVVAMLGPSGCGKTTTLRLIAGLERLDGGRLEIGGVLVDDGARVFVPPEQRGLGMVFQSYALWPHKNVVDNVAYPLERHGVPAAQRRALAVAALARVRLDHLADRPVHALSGGQQQRVAVARAIVGDGTKAPGLLLLDEPLANLDAQLREAMRAELATLARAAGATVVLVTHDQAEAFAIADDVVVLRAGTVAQQGSPEDIYLRPVDAFVGGFGGAMAFVDGVRAGAGVRIGDLVVDGTIVSLGGGDGTIVDGGRVVVGLRPEWLRAAVGDEAGLDVVVTHRLFVGREHELSLRLGDDTALSWRVPSTTTPPLPGDRLRIVPTRACVFPAAAAA